MQNTTGTAKTPRGPPIDGSPVGRRAGSFACRTHTHARAQKKGRPFFVAALLDALVNDGVPRQPSRLMTASDVTQSVIKPSPRIHLFFHERAIFRRRPRRRRRRACPYYYIYIYSRAGPG